MLSKFSGFYGHEKHPKSNVQRYGRLSRLCKCRSNQGPVGASFPNVRSEPRAFLPWTLKFIHARLATWRIPKGCFRRSSGFQLKLTANSRGLLRVTCARRVRPRILKSNWAGSPNTDSTESFAPVSERSTTPHTTDLPVANRICAVASVSVRAEALRSPADWVVRFPNTIRSGCSQTALRKLPRASKRLFLRSLSCLSSSDFESRGGSPRQLQSPRCRIVPMPYRT